MLSQDARVPVVCLTRGAGQIISVKSPRAPTSPDDDFRGVVPAVGTSAPSMPPPQSGYIFFEGSACSQRRPLLSGSEFGNGDQRPHRRYPLPWLKLDNGGTRP